MAGYSNTPLAQKLGLTTKARTGVLHAPENYKHLLPELYPSMATSLTGKFDWLHAFYTQKDKLEDEFAALKTHISPAGQLWISWPKKTSGVASDINENIIRDIGLKHGLVDVKVAAIDDSWSGLKFIYRLKDR